MKHAGLALAALILVSQSVRIHSEDHPRIFLVGTYLGNEMRPDSPNPDSSGLHRTYYVRTDEGTWSLVSDSDAGDVLAHTVAWSPLRAREEHPTLLDSLKRWEKFAFRAEPDRRIGGTQNSYLVYIPRADDPQKEDRFDADFIPRPSPAPAPTDNVKAMCDTHRFTAEQEKQYCANQ
jgi:hypothetical protein